jgi:hypothetical protein
MNKAIPNSTFEKPHHMMGYSRSREVNSESLSLNVICQLTLCIAGLGRQCCWKRGKDFVSFGGRVHCSIEIGVVAWFVLFKGGENVEIGVQFLQGKNRTVISFGYQAFDGAAGNGR